MTTAIAIPRPGAILRAPNRRTDVPPPLPLLLAREFPPGTLLRRHRDGSLLHCAHGVFAPVPAPDLPRWQARFLEIEARIQAQRYAFPRGAVITREHAAFLHGSSYLSVPDRVHLATPQKNSRIDRSQFTLRHHQVLQADQMTDVAGLPVTNRVRTAVDTARHSSLVNAAIVMSSLMRLGSAPDRRQRPASESRAEEFRWQTVSILDAEPRHRGNRRARAVAAVANVWTESPLEVLSHLDALMLGLPEPQFQEEFWINGNQYFVDALFRGVTPTGQPWAVGLESDGYLKYQDDRTYWVRQQQRDNDLRSVGVAPVHVSWEISSNLDSFARTVLPAFPQHVRQHLRPHAALLQLRSS